jgi:hypothetical protein
MCLLCEELWMPFGLPPEPKARPFVAEALEPEDTNAQAEEAVAPPIPDSTAAGRP